MVVVVNNPRDYYVAATRSNLSSDWTHTVSDMRLTNVPLAGLLISVETGDHVWPVSAIVNDGGFIHLTGLHEGHLPMIWTWSNCNGRFRYCGTRKYYPPIFHS